METNEYPLPARAMSEIPQEQAAEIFAAQRKLLAELQRLRDANQRLRVGLFWQKRRWGVPEDAAWDCVDAVEAGT